MDEKTLRSIQRVITHAGCSDGIISAAIIRQVLPRVSVEFCTYNTPETNNLVITPGMLFVDFTPPEHLVDKCVEAGAIVLDHHKGQEDIVRRFGERGVFADENKDTGISGAILAFREVLAPLYGAFGVGSTEDCDTLENIRRLAYLIGVRDTWVKQASVWHQACAISAAVKFLGADYWLTCGPCIEDWHVDVGQACVRQRDTQVQSALRNMCYHYECPTLGIAVFNDGSGIISDVAEAVFEKGTASVVCGFAYQKNKHQANGEVMLSFSLRSDDTFNVASLAKKNGGGGHTKAAGFAVYQAIGRLENPYIYIRDLILKEANEQLSST